MSAKAELDAAWEALLASPEYAAWKRANKKEDRRLLDYRRGSHARPRLQTSFGQAAVSETAAWRAA